MWPDTTSECAKQHGAGLIPGSGQIAARALLLDQQDARLEQVAEAGGIGEPPDVLLVARHGVPPDAEDPEELVVEALGLALLIRRIDPLASERGRPGADLVP